MLPESQRQVLKSIINSEIGIVREVIAELSKLLKPVPPDNAIGRLSRMDALEMQSVNQVKLDSQNQRLFELDQALARLAGNPDFGICLECGESIALERLRLRPESGYCLACQQAVSDAR